MRLTPKAHAARAMLLGRWYDANTSTYRYRSPEGSHYTYSGALNAHDLTPMPKGDVWHIEKAYSGREGANTVSKRRLGLDGKE